MRPLDAPGSSTLGPVSPITPALTPPQAAATSCTLCEPGQAHGRMSGAAGGSEHTADKGQSCDGAAAEGTRNRVLFHPALGSGRLRWGTGATCWAEGAAPPPAGSQSPLNEVDAAMEGKGVIPPPCSLLIAVVAPGGGAGTGRPHPPSPASLGVLGARLGAGSRWQWHHTEPPPCPQAGCCGDKRPWAGRRLGTRHMAGRWPLPWLSHCPRTPARGTLSCSHCPRIRDPNPQQHRAKRMCDHTGNSHLCHSPQTQLP